MSNICSKLCPKSFLSWYVRVMKLHSCNGLGTSKVDGYNILKCIAVIEFWNIAYLTKSKLYMNIWTVISIKLLIF